MKKIIPALAIILIATNSASGLILQPTPSMPGTLYKYSSSNDIGKGDVVQFEIIHPYIMEGEPTLLIKRVKCMSGQSLEIDESGFVLCDRKYLGTASDRVSDDKKRTFKMFRYKNDVPEGKVFVMGDHPLSFDSRYYGFVDVSKLKKVEKIF